jgi:hypothetical protein
MAWVMPSSWPVIPLLTSSKSECESGHNSEDFLEIAQETRFHVFTVILAGDLITRQRPEKAYKPKPAAFSERFLRLSHLLNLQGGSHWLESVWGLYFLALASFSFSALVA